MGLSTRTFRTDKRDWVILSMFLVLAFVLRSPSFLKSVLAWDEGLYFLMARSMVDGALPYVEIWDHKPPGIFVLFALAQILLGQSVLAMRVFACLATAFTGYLLYRIGKLVGKDGKIGLLSGILYVAFSLNSEGLAANTEIFYLAFVTLAYYLLFTSYPWKPLGSAGPKLLLVGLVFGMALQIQYVVVFDLAAVFTIVGIDLFLHRRERTENFLASILKSYALLSIGPVLIFLLVALYFTLSGHLQDYLDANVLANAQYISPSGLSWAKLKPVVRQQIASYALIWISLLLAPIYLILFADSNREEKKSIVALLIWSSMAFLGICATQRFYPHYFLHLLPPACLLCAYLIARIVSFKPYLLVPKKQAFTWGLIVFVPLLQNIYPTLEMGVELVYYRHVRGIEHWGDEISVVAEYLHERVQPQDYIYAVDYPPAIYYLVPAKTPTRYPFPPHLINEQGFKTPGVDPILELAAIIEKQPIYVVKQYQLNNPFYTELERYLDRYYVLENSINDVQLYRLQSDL